MALNLLSPWPSRLSHPPNLPKFPDFPPKSNLALFSFLLATSCSSVRLSIPRASISDDASASVQVDEALLSRVSAVKNADEALEIIAEVSDVNFGVVSVSDCCAIISSALDRNNPELALSVFYAMRSSFDQGVSENGWKWSRPNVSVYIILVEGLASSLKVSDALKMLDYISRVGVSPSDEEVPFGKVVRCPTCMVAVAVAQPQHGIQVASCSKCRYQYELVSGDIISINSEEISKDLPAWEKGLRFLQLMKRSIPVAVHSLVVQTPSGTARTHRFATETVDLPAQEGERVTIASAPTNVYRNVGPFKFSPKAPNTYPGEAMCLTNHENGRESLLLRAPMKDERLSLRNPSILIPLLAVLATGDAASGIIDPSLPQFISVAAIASLGVGATLNILVFPRLNQLPQRSVDAIGFKQRLLSQYDVLQSRIKDLKLAAEKEIWMLARMCQLENKIFAVGEPSYRARRTRVKRVREGLESSLKGRIELIDSYARISSMIEIEVEMDSDVLAAEAASNAETIAEQIEQIMELENLEEKWRIQAEANDEAERLLSSQPIPAEQK